MAARRKPRRDPRIGAFFDMDKTLIDENSGTLYMKYRWERGEISRWDLVSGLQAYLRYKLGLLDIRAWTQGMMLQFKGQSERSLTREANVWFRERVAQHIYPDAEELVRRHQKDGHLVAIVSGATKFVVRPLAARLGIKKLLYTRLETEDGRFTGRVVEPICFEEGKIYWLQHLVEEEGIDLAKSWFYTDSITDLPLLELVGHPVVVNPDPRLYGVAVRRRWPVRFFRPPMADTDRQLTTEASGPSPRRPTSTSRP